MKRKDADDLSALAVLFRERRKPVAPGLPDDDDQDPPGVHHGHARPPRSAEIVPFRLRYRQPDYAGQGRWSTRQVAGSAQEASVRARSRGREVPSKISLKMGQMALEMPKNPTISLTTL
jgi:hypothetical protein